MKYTFGTSEAAASRLETIAQFFNPLASEFIGQHVTGPIQSAVDLGCGPGFSTDMLRRATGADEVLGLDTSADFLKMAAERFGDCLFREHDVRKTPLPARGSIMYVRFLLSHLGDVVELVNRWVGELADHGTLFIEELEDIDTDIDVFQKYLDTNSGIIASQGASLYVGDVLADGEYAATVVHNGRATIPVANSQAATWFLPNTLTIWEENDYALEHLTAEERREVSTELTRIKESEDMSSGITWHMRRLALSRAAQDET